MSYVKAKMHQIRFSFCADPTGGSLQCSPDLAEFKGPTSKGRKGNGREGKERGREAKGKGMKGREGSGGSRGVGGMPSLLLAWQFKF